MPAGQRGVVTSTASPSSACPNLSGKGTARPAAQAGPYLRTPPLGDEACPAQVRPPARWGASNPTPPSQQPWLGLTVRKGRGTPCAARRGGITRCTPAHVSNAPGWGPPGKVCEYKRGRFGLCPPLPGPDPVVRASRLSAECDVLSTGLPFIPSGGLIRGNERTSTKAKTQTARQSKSRMRAAMPTNLCLQSCFFCTEPDLSFPYTFHLAKQYCKPRFEAP